MIRLLLFLKRHAWPIASVLLIGMGILFGTIFYWYPFRGAKAQTVMLERQLKEQKAEKASLQKLYEAIKGKLQSLEADRDNIMVQTNQLLGEKDAFLTADANLKTLTVEHNKLLEAQKKTEESLKAVQSRADELKSSLDRALAEAVASKAESSRLAQENSSLAFDFKEGTARAIKSEEEAAYYKKFQESFLSLSRSYEILEKDRKILKKQLQDLPKKFSDMARENRILVKETGDMHYNLGVFYAGEMNYDRALEEFKKAIDINPNDAKAHYNLGYIYAEHRQDRSKAEYYFREFLGLAPDDPDANAAKSYLAEQDAFNTNVLKTV